MNSVKGATQNILKNWSDKVTLGKY